MRHVIEGDYIRVQARTARRVFLAGGEVGISGPGQHADEALYCREPKGATLDDWEEVHFCLWADECIDVRPFRLWYWVTISDKHQYAAPRRNHDPDERYHLAKRINAAFAAAGHAAPIDPGRAPMIPRRLLRTLWREVRDTLSQDAINNAAANVSM